MAQSKRTRPGLAVRVLLLVLPVAGGSPPAGLALGPDADGAGESLGPALNLTDQNWLRWRDHLRPQASELAFERIDWLPSFGAGLLRADAEAKPLLLWVMNGHPLGCT